MPRIIRKKVSGVTGEIGEIVSSGDMSQSTSSGTFTAVTNSVVSLKTSGNPVKISFNSASNVNAGFFRGVSSSDEVTVAFELRRGGVPIKVVRFRTTSTGSTGSTIEIPTLGSFTDNPGAGTFTYQLFMATISGSTPTVEIVEMEMEASEEI